MHQDLVAVAADAERQASRLRDRLAAIEAEQATLEAELAVFEADYTRVVVAVLADLHAVEARLLTLVAERSGRREDARAAFDARTRAGETQSAMSAIATPPDPVPPAELKRLFREAAKRMHPDLAGGDDARRHAEAFMKRLNDAYRVSDAEAIQDLVRQWEASPYADGEPRPAAEAQRRLAALQAAVARAERRLDELRASELAQLMERAMTAAAEGRDLLAELRASAEAALRSARARLAELEG